MQYKAWMNYCNVFSCLCNTQENSYIAILSCLSNKQPLFFDLPCHLCRTKVHLYLQRLLFSLYSTVPSLLYPARDLYSNVRDSRICLTATYPHITGSHVLTSFTACPILNVCVWIRKGFQVMSKRRAGLFFGVLTPIHVSIYLWQT